MTDITALTQYRLGQAQETLDEARTMLNGNFTSRTIVNRAYYSVFYALLALHLGSGNRLKTSKHSGVMSSFDLNFVKPGLLTRQLSEYVHILFDLRQEADYRELAEVSNEEAAEAVRMAETVVTGIQNYLK